MGKKEKVEKKEENVDNAEGVNVEESKEEIKELQLDSKDQTKMKKFSEAERIRALTEENLMLKKQLLALSKDLNDSRAALTSTQAHLLEIEAVKVTEGFQGEREQYQTFVNDLSKKLNLSDGNWVYNAEAGTMLKQDPPQDATSLNTQQREANNG